jgi:hypothetical protein
VGERRGDPRLVALADDREPTGVQVRPLEAQDGDLVAPPGVAKRGEHSVAELAADTRLVARPTRICPASASA